MDSREDVIAAVAKKKMQRHSSFDYLENLSLFSQSNLNVNVNNFSANT